MSGRPIHAIMQEGRGLSSGALVAIRTMFEVSAWRAALVVLMPAIQGALAPAQMITSGLVVGAALAHRNPVPNLLLYGCMLALRQFGLAVPLIVVRHVVLFFLELASWRILFTACSEHPGGAWAAQQARNLAWQLQEAEEIKPRFLIHDRDANFPAAFDAVFRAEGLEVIRTPVRAPNANSRCERWVSSVRRECLDLLLIVGRRHLEAVLAEYVEHYNGHRPHRSLELRAPRGPTVIPATTGGQVVSRARVQGLINEYSRQAA
jgi:hypothetical protein